MLGREVFLKAGCPVWQCETYDYNSTENEGTAWKEYDALIVSNWDLEEELLTNVSRLPHQNYVFWSIEAPTATWPASVNIAFNLTITYRWDSDVVLPYGWSYPKERLVDDERKTPISRESKVVKNYARGKTKLAAWFVSNCYANNGRMEYVERLQQFVQIDIYGACGTLNCSSMVAKWFDDSCREMVRTFIALLIVSNYNKLCFKIDNVVHFSCNVIINSSWR